jgi:hypothetical protein
MNVHPAETFPLALAATIFVQQLIFVTVQSTGLNSVLVTGCAGLAQIVFPSELDSLLFSADDANRERRFIHLRIYDISIRDRDDSTVIAEESIRAPGEMEHSNLRD